MSVAALIPAAGSGVRLGQGPKAWVTLAGESLLSRAVAAFEGCVDEVWVGVAPALSARAEEELSGRARVVCGGATRQESVYNLLRAAQAEVVLVHDAARPFLEAAVIERVVAAVRAHGAASVVTAVADSLIEAASGRVVDRAPLRAVQTPQGFRRELLLAAHERARERALEATDDAALVRALGHPVALVEGSSWLFKVTTPADLELARALAPLWDARLSGPK
ncbi:2-C-methyl-D-erythritol 4-phosphate cytidylyltransferase [Truepera radiovictrix]|uniref:2-C-methyl-D-erythritol 4-phosphate cytidylyltransferase n=1 Tax=Truepera radiovictrix (strain DSM 17093 / CIP 108686 / LMG 22925 / RQ-24) TaxID=649638 RepID=D7CV84_TRURR|nr:2-C-methyl-D-erythritol 4-phosphate cytidylyltransferase [Truepera radiovictrix]ADI14112.1 2-C-methyl-D-erythritol 4-phosphate cytidylyltransferase [Truepera radiovictrix DSM 17093]WMT57326.1 2-C-methyl-D-erythritol 4-phosphate cytidylyltransferase [Truepera radiovictrix]